MDSFWKTCSVLHFTEDGVFCAASCRSSTKILDEFVQKKQGRHIIVCGPTLPELVCCFKTSAEDVAYP